jgi:hypothetical protein
MTGNAAHASLNLCKSRHLDGSVHGLDAALHLESLPFRKNERMFDEKSILDAELRRRRHARSVWDEMPVYGNRPWYGPRDYPDIYGSRPDLVRRHDGGRGS